MGSSHIQTNVRQERISDLSSSLNPFADGSEDQERMSAPKQQRTTWQPRRRPPPLPADARK